MIATPFWPAYITRERIEKAPKLRLLLTAGVGSDHFDLAAAAEHNVTVAEITGSNVVSVAEHVVMQILTLVRNYIPAYYEVIEGGWDIGKIAAKSHDLEDKTVGIVGMGRIGQRVAARLKPFDVDTYYFDYRRLSTTEEQLLGARYSNLDALIRRCDVISINIPLTPATQGLFNRERLYSMKQGAYLVNTARGRIVETDAPRGGDGARSPGRLCWRRVVPAARASRPSLAEDAQSCNDATHLRNITGGTETVRGWYPRLLD